MAEHTFIKSAKYVALGLAAIQEQALLPNIFKKVGGDTFKNALNDTVTWRTARVTSARDYEWRTRTAPIILDKIGQNVVSIKLDTHIYQGVAVTDEQATMDITNFAQEIVVPQTQALADRAEGKVLAGLKSANFKTAIPAFYENDDPYKWALRVRALLNKQGAPAAGRYLLVGAAVENWLLGSDRIAPSGATPETSRAVREATLGRLAGFEIVPVPLLGEFEVYAVTRDALVIANVAPVVPRGVVDGARNSYRGWNMRHIFSYDGSYLQDGSILSMFMGVNSVNDELEIEKDDQGIPRLKVDENGDPIPTGKNVRGAKGTLTEGDRPTP